MPSERRNEMSDTEFDKEKEIGEGEEASVVSRHPTFGEEDMIHGVEALKPRTFADKLKNFWYHYKWPSIIAFVLLVVVVGASTSTCVREDFDVSVMIAGPLELGGQTTRDIANSVEALSKDYDGNGEVSVAVNPLYIANYEDLRDSDNPAAGSLAALSKKNRETFELEVMTGTYLICIFSEELWKEVNDADGFLPITDYLPEGDAYADATYYGGEVKTGIRLGDTAFGSALGVNTLPKDLVLCIRRPSAVSAWYQSLLPWAKDGNAERHAFHEDTMRAILAYKGEDAE